MFKMFPFYIPFISLTSSSVNQFVLEEEEEEDLFITLQ